MISDKLLNEIDRGRLGLNHGISMNLPKLESIIDGVTRETYTLIMSNSGAGKEDCRLYKELYKELSGNIGEKLIIENTEINSEIKKSESSYSVEVEN